MNLDDIKIFLPKYLSALSHQELFKGLKDFPSNLDKRLYTNHLQEPIIYQGDGLRDLLVVRLPEADVKTANCLVLSNSCDTEISNQRLFPSQIVYSPIVNLDKYKQGLLKTINPEKVTDHIQSIKNQQITQIFYLPQFGSTLDESIIFVDRIFNIQNDFIEREKLNDTRIFSLSDYGFYLFILKLSINFTRIQEKVDRKSVNIPL